MNDQKHTQAALENTPSRGRCTLRITAFGLAACAVGLLLWSRLILVTNHPRTAIANPAPQSARNDNRPPETQRAEINGENSRR